jgi:hypothetical protein
MIPNKVRMDLGKLKWKLKKRKGTKSKSKIESLADLRRNSMEDVRNLEKYETENEERKGTRIFSENRKENEEYWLENGLREGKKKQRENSIFSRKYSGKFLQGGYQICSDTMLRNMASMKIREKNLKCNY